MVSSAILLFLYRTLYIHLSPVAGPAAVAVAAAIASSSSYKAAMGGPQEAPEGPQMQIDNAVACTLPMRRLHTTALVGGPEEGAPSAGSVPLQHSVSSLGQQQQQQQLEKRSSMGPPRPKRRLISRPELLRHSSCSLLRMLSSSSLILGPRDSMTEQTQMQQEGVLLLYITGNALQT